MPRIDSTAGMNANATQNFTEAQKVDTKLVTDGRDSAQQAENLPELLTLPPALPSANINSFRDQ
jgi:hypothetical protein